MAREDWETESGLWDDVDFWIDRSYFGYNQDYMQGQVPLLIWEGHSPDDESATGLIIPIGSGWRIVGKNGERVEHEKGKKKFNTRSIYGILIKRVVEELGDDGKADWVQPLIERSPREASVWVGLGFHLKRETIKYPGLGEGGTERETVRPMPVRFIGHAGSGAGAGVASVPPAAAPAAQMSAGASGTTQQLVALAKALDRPAFQKKALDMADVMADPALLSQIMDDSESGFWARVRAGSLS